MIGLVCLLLSAAGALAAGHWTVNPYGFQYDMTVYATLKIGQHAIADYDDYEVAAFSGDECRGVAKVQTTTDGGKVLYLRIYSNVSQGETIRLRAYISSKDEVVVFSETVDFVADSMSGTPGEPLALTLETLQPGDANGDGTVSIADVTAIINKINNAVSGTFVETAADVNGDGVISIADVTGVINIINQ